MARFSRTEPKIADLARVLGAGLEAARGDFPDPPVGSRQFQAMLEEFTEATGAVTTA